MMTHIGIVGMSSIVDLVSLVSPSRAYRLTMTLGMGHPFTDERFFPAGEGAGVITEEGAPLSA